MAVSYTHLDVYKRQLSGCEKDTLLDKKDPVTVSFWHVYGEQSGSPMDLLVQELSLIHIWGRKVCPVCGRANSAGRTDCADLSLIHISVQSLGPL